MKNERIYALVRRVPPGRVATYGQIASLAGLGRHARLVGYALSRLAEDSDVPWHRIVNAKGSISTRAGDSYHERRQHELLRTEGVVFRRDGAVDLDLYRWVPSGVAGEEISDPGRPDDASSVRTVEQSAQHGWPVAASRRTGRCRVHQDHLLNDTQAALQAPVKELGVGSRDQEAGAGELVD